MFETALDVNVNTACCHKNVQKHLRNSCWLTEEYGLKTCRLSFFFFSLCFALSTFISLILELSIIYIKNDTRIICQFISVTISDMLNVQRCWLWQFRTCGTAREQTWSRLSVAIIKRYRTQHLLTLQRSQLFPSTWERWVLSNQQSRGSVLLVAKGGRLWPPRCPPNPSSSSSSCSSLTTRNTHLTPHNREKKKGGGGVSGCREESFIFS